MLGNEDSPRKSEPVIIQANSAGGNATSSWRNQSFAADYGLSKLVLSQAGLRAATSTRRLCCR